RGDFFSMICGIALKSCKRDGRLLSWWWQPVGDKDVHSATLHAWWHITQFCSGKIATAWLYAANCQRQLAAHTIAFGNCVA
ncbi:MAG: hypothetical protein LBK44_03765, partial [Spirochaetales bacterium]|nr:hypothetical protein [Spirochaetales bacterium]